MNRILVAAFACLLLAACASDGSTDTTEEMSDTTPAAAPDTTAAPETTDAPETTASGSGSAGTITMSNLSFSGTPTVQVGDTIELVNQDDVPHTFTDENEAFDVSISGGQSATYTFEEAGEYSYFCTIHPSMTGTITVEG